MGRAAARVLVVALTGLFAGGAATARCSFAAAAPEPGPPAPPPAAVKVVDTIIGTIDEQAVERIDEGHAEQERVFGEIFERVDRVFGEAYIEDRERKAQVRAGLETTFNDDGTSIGTAVRLGLRVPLPALKRRFNLFLDVGEDVNQLGAVSSPNFTDSEKVFSLGAGLLRRYRDNLEAGIKLRLLPGSGGIFSINPFVRFEQQRGPERYFFEQRLIWGSDNSWRSLTTFDVDHRFESRILLRLSNRADYSFENPGASMAHGLIVRRNVLDASGLSLELWLEYNTAKKDDPDTMADDTTVYAQLRMRGRVWRNWIQYELRPIFTIPTNTDRNPFIAFFVGLTVIWDSYLGGASPLAALQPEGAEPSR